MAASDPLNMIQHCASCASCCCRGDVIVATDTERQTIIDRGHPDHFRPVTWNRKDFYILDFRHPTSCPYLSDKNLCTVQDVKPALCRIYPARLDQDDEIVFKDSCPASPFLGDAFKDAIRDLALRTYYITIPPELYEKLINKYLALEAGSFLGNAWRHMRERCSKYWH